MAGNSDYRAGGLTSAAGYDPNAKYLGGSKEASDAEAYDRGREADIAQNRQGVQVDNRRANYAAHQANYARTRQGEAMGLMRARATGQAPSIAQMQADRQMQQAAAAQASAAAGARGPAGLAMAQQQAAANTAAAQGNISAQAQIAAAQERQAAEQAYFGAASGIRQGDMGQQGIYANQALAQAQLNAQQRALNDQRSLAYDQGAWDVNNRNQQAAMQEQNNIAQAHTAANSQNAETNRQNAQNKFGWRDAAGLANGVAGALGGALALSDVRAKTNVQSLDENPNAYGSGVGNNPGMAITVPLQGVGNAQALSGYANERANQPGGLFPSPPTDPNAGMAPGTADYMHAMGGDASLNGTGKPDQSAAAAGGMKMGMGYAQPENPDKLPDGVGKQSFNAASFFRMLSDEKAKEKRKVITPDPMTHALAAMRPYSYEYKPGMGEPGENVGPMAQDMASNPITGSAVMPDPSTGMLAIDGQKATKLSLAGIGHLAKKVERLEGLLKAKKRKGGK